MMFLFEIGIVVMVLGVCLSLLTAIAGMSTLPFAVWLCLQATALITSYAGWIFLTMAD